MDICGNVLVSKDTLKFALKCLYCEIDLDEWESFVAHIQSLHHTDEEPCIYPTVQLDCKESMSFEWMKEESDLHDTATQNKESVNDLKLEISSTEEFVECERMEGPVSDSCKDSEYDGDEKGDDSDVESTNYLFAKDTKLSKGIFKPTFVRQNAYTSVLIEVLQKSSCLWNPDDKDYSNNRARAKCKQEIIKEIKKRCGITLNNKTLWKNIHVLYTNYKATMSSIEEKTESKLKKLSDVVMGYFEKCSFLAGTPEGFLDIEDESPNTSQIDNPISINDNDSDIDDRKENSSEFKPTFSKQNANTSVLIEIFENSSCLWNPDDKNYNNNTARAHSKKEMIKEMKKRCHISLNNKTLLKSLRVLYTRYRATALAIEKQGSKSKPKKMSAVVRAYFEKCSFLASAQEGFLDIEDETPNTNSNLSFATLNSTTIAFIETYSRFPSLYDSKHEDYCYVLLRKQKYKEMAKILKAEHNIELSDNEIYKGIYYLRHWYFKIKERNGKRSNKQTLSSASQFYLDKCNFLPDRITREKTKCPECDKSFQTRAVKQVHMYKQHNIGELPYKCQECNKTFSSNAALRGHQNRNHMEKVHKCEFCERSFAVLPDLKHHMEMHTGHKPFICELCGKAFRTKTRMGYHKNAIHIKLRAFKCNMCPKDFLKARDLKDHIKSHLNIRDKICETCGKGFTNSHALIRHRQLHAEVKKFACKFCEKRFYQFVGLNSHMKHRHGIYKNKQRKSIKEVENIDVVTKINP
ncbi:uncharacterized protein [Eurosta solidaginis]|uniref:uncharacterized protein isoform X2 n=1 Tax=Eurosta solidaginis TaxID=178769 RepID=UPI003530CE81